MGFITQLKLVAVVCLFIIRDECSGEPKLELSSNTDEKQNEGNECADTAIAQDNLVFLSKAGKDELSEAKSETLKEDSDSADAVKWEASDSPHLWKKSGQLSKRRIEIHPKSEGRVTLTQIEKECEESMRKQLKENQHKKKLQFSFIGKRNSSELPINPCECHQETVSFPDVNIARERRANEKSVMKSQADLKTVGKGWLIPSAISSGDRIIPSNNVKSSEDNSTQVTNKLTDNNLTLSGLDLQKKNQAEKIIKSINPSSVQNLDTVELGQMGHENKAVMKEITDCEDRDLKLLKLLYEGLNAKDMGANDVEPLVKTLKDIADKKIAMNMITNNITTKPVAMKLDDKSKIGGQMKCANELYAKIKEYKEKHLEKKIINNHFGSSPLNPCLINTRKDTYYPISNKNAFSSQPKRTYTNIFSFPKKSSGIMSDSSLPEQNDPFEVILPNQDNSADKSSEYAVFVKLIDKILSSVSEDNPKTNELLHDLNRKLLGTDKDVSSYKMLEDLVKEFGSSVVKVKGSSGKFSDKAEEPFEDLLRSSREIKNIRDRYLENRARSNQNQTSGKSADQPALNSTVKHPIKNWSKSDELRRLQKVATELKSKIDDLLTNLEGSVTDTDDDDEEDDEEDDDEEDGEDETMLRDVSNRVNTGPRRNKICDDPFESFKKFKSTDSKMEKRKFKEYEPKGRENRLSKIVGKKPVTMGSRFKSFEDKNKDAKSKCFKSKRDKRQEEYNRYYDKYDIYNFKSSRRKNEFGRHVVTSCDTNDYSPVVIEPSRMVHIANEFPLNYKNSDTNFNVFKVANEFQKVHRDMIDKRMQSSVPRQSGINKYLGNNQINGTIDVKKANLDSELHKYGGKLPKIGEFNQDFELVLNDNDNHKPNNTDIPHWLDYNDSEVKSKCEGPNILATVKKKQFKKCITPFDKRIDDIVNQYRIRRSLMNLFDYFKSSKEKMDEKLINNEVSKEIKKIETNTELNAPNNDDKPTLLETKETTESLKTASKIQQEEATEPPLALENSEAHKSARLALKIKE